MAAGAEVDSSHAVVDPTKAAKANDQKLKQPKAQKQKKPRAASKPATAAHPPYLQMIKEAISSLKERTGSSQYAIAKFLEEKYKSGLPANYKKMLNVQLRNLSKQGKLTKVKGSFKLSEALKKPSSAPKAPKVAKPSASSAPRVTKKAVKVPKSPKAKAAAAPKPKKVAAAPKPKPRASVKAAAPAKKAPAQRKVAAPKAPKTVKSAKHPAKVVKPKKAVPAAKKAKKI